MKRYRVWFLDVLRFRYGITVECKEDDLDLLIRRLEIFGCTFENSHEYSDAAY